MAQSPARQKEVAPKQEEEPVVDADVSPETLEKRPAIRDYFRLRPLPWWVCFLGGIFLLTKLQLVYNDSPCAVLGTQSPVSKGDIAKAFRTLSLCTHPDRLRGRLKRTPTQAESRRGEIIFNRASAAKDELMKVLRQSSKKKVACYQGELEMAVFAFFQQAGAAVAGLGIYDYFDMGKELVWNIITFESGIMNTILSLLWMMFLLRILKQFLLYLWRMGIIRGTLGIVTTVIIGPIPTVLYFLFLPFMRCYVFTSNLVAGLRSDEGNAAAPSTTEAPTEAATPAEATPTEAPEAKAATTAHMKVATDKAELPRNLRQRKKKESEEEKERRNQNLINGAAPGTPEAANAEIVKPGGPMPEGAWNCVTWTISQPLKARQLAADAVQFDLLLILTKPIIPLFMLIALGQVWNGLFSSLIVGHALRKWVPQMSYEAHHLLCMFFGAVHTLLGVNAQQVEEYAKNEGKQILHLVWTWSFKDVLAVMHMCLLGSTVTAMSSLGNEPSYASSFAAGIALRIAFAQDSIRGLSPVQNAAGYVEARLRDLGVALEAAEEVVAYSGDGIGDCSGGPFRMLFGDGPASLWTARILKIWLMLLPMMATGQWLLRTVHAGRMLGKRHKMTRFVQRLILFFLGLLQCILLANLELNASNGVLGNFWVAMLVGCAGESLLSTYDVRGPVRQVIFLLLFVLI